MAMVIDALLQSNQFSDLEQIAWLERVGVSGSAAKGTADFACSAFARSAVCRFCTRASNSSLSRISFTHVA